MGRAKIAMEFIGKEKTRNTTYVKRKKGLLKKGHEFSILCNVPVCIIIYPYKQGKQSMEAEIYSFIGDSNSMDLARAMNPKIAKEIIDRYLSVPNDEKYKRSLNLYDMFDEWKRKADQELSKLRHKNALSKYPSWDSRFDGLTTDQLMEFLVHLDEKIEFVRQRIAMIKSSNTTATTNNNHVQEVALVPYFDQATPISSVMIPNHENNDHQIGYPYIEGYNQFSSFNYPINNSYNHQQYCHQVVPFNYPNAFPDHQVGATRMDDHGSSSSSDHQVGATRMDDHGGSSSKASNMMYNMNTMAGVVPMYNDQGRGIVDNIGATSTYGAGLPMSMPLQSLPMLPNASLPRQRQYQMFYK